MPYLVDTIEVEPHCLAPYLEVVEHLGVPVMTEAGASFVSCAATSTDTDERVEVQIVWGCRRPRAVERDPQEHRPRSALVRVRRPGCRPAGGGHPPFLLSRRLLASLMETRPTGTPRPVACRATKPRAPAF